MTQAIKLTLSVILTLAATAALSPLAIDMYVPAMSQISHELGVTSGAVQLTLTAYTAAFAIGQLFSGPITDSFGRKPVLVTGIIIFIAMSILSALVTNIAGLTWARAIQGMAGASISIALLAALRDEFNKEDFARVISYVTLAMIFAPLVAPIVGGYLTVWFGWSSIFWVLSVISIVTLLAAYIKIPETLKDEHRQSFNVYNSLRHYRGLFKNGRAMALMLTSGFNFASMFAFLTGGSFIYIHLFAIPVQHVGYLYGINIISMIIMTVINARFVKRRGLSWMLQFGLVIHFAGGLLLLAGQFLNLGLWAMVSSVMLIIGTLPVIASNSMALILEDNPHIAGTAVSLIGTVRFGMGAIAAAIISNFKMTTVWPMILTMAACSTLAFFTYWMAVKRPTLSRIDINNNS